MDDWPLAKILHQISGGKPWSVAVDALRRRDRLYGVLLLRGVCHSLVVVPPGTERDFVAADHPLGNSVGAIG